MPGQLQNILCYDLFKTNIYIKTNIKKVGIQAKRVLRTVENGANRLRSAATTDNNIQNTKCENSNTYAH